MTDEHIFPMWLLHRYELLDARLVLLNDTTIPYRSLTIPCCEKCNREYLSSIENRIKRAVSSGPEAVSELSEIDIFIWLAKIQYGVLRKELVMLMNRSDPSSGSIAPTELMKYFRAHRHLVNICRKKPHLAGLEMFSLFRLRCLAFGDHRDFGYVDSVFHYSRKDIDLDTDTVHVWACPAVAIKLGEVGWVLSMGDNGLVKQYMARYIEPIIPVALHPIQFDELVARIFYQRSLIRRGAAFISLESEENESDATVLTLPINGFSIDSPFEARNPRQLAEVMHRHLHRWGLDFDDLFRDPNMVLTYLYDANDLPIVFPKEVLREPGLGVVRVSES